MSARKTIKYILGPLPLAADTRYRLRLAHSGAMLDPPEHIEDSTSQAMPMRRRVMVSVRRVALEC